MTVGGWYDNEDLYGALHTSQAIEKQNPGIFNVLVMGPWDHGGWSWRDGDWLGTAYFGQKTGDYYRSKLERRSCSAPVGRKIVRSFGSVRYSAAVPLRNRRMPAHLS